MVDIKAFPYLCFVRFDLVNKEFDRQFNIHIPAPGNCSMPLITPRLAPTQSAST